MMVIIDIPENDDDDDEFDRLLASPKSTEHLKKMADKAQADYDAGLTLDMKTVFGLLKDDAPPSFLQALEYQKNKAGG